VEKVGILVTDESYIKNGIKIIAKQSPNTNDFSF
jgi:hypothetical protein